MTKYTQLIEQAVHEPGPTAEEVCKSIQLPQGALQERPLSQNTILIILDKRWYFNGVPKLKQIYDELRITAIKEQDYDDYMMLHCEFEEAINEQVSFNFDELLKYLGLDK